jgi:hypothetical protein
MTEQTTQQVTQGIDLFNQLTQSGAATALIFGLVLGLGLSMAAKVPAHELIERDRIANWAVYMTCILGAFLACWLLWPPAPWRARLAFSMSIACATPLIWLLIVGILGLIRPQWKQALSLHRISFEDETPSQPTTKEPTP